MAEVYTTISGDTWDGIAYKKLGSGYYMDLLIAENPQYSDYFVFPAGIKLKLPEIEETTSSSLPPWHQ
ncbi:MAG: tail protein X [Clostridiales bacterium]|nr:tail protein X [Clostridiales bacterium]